MRVRAVSVWPSNGGTECNSSLAHLERRRACATTPCDFCTTRYSSGIPANTAADGLGAAVSTASCTDLSEGRACLLRSCDAGYVANPGGAAVLLCDVALETASKLRVEWFDGSPPLVCSTAECVPPTTRACRAPRGARVGSEVCGSGVAMAGLLLPISCPFCGRFEMLVCSHRTVRSRRRRLVTCCASRTWPSTRSTSPLLVTQGSTRLERPLPLRAPTMAKHTRSLVAKRQARSPHLLLLLRRPRRPRSRRLHRQVPRRPALAALRSPRRQARAPPRTSHVTAEPPTRIATVHCQPKPRWCAGS